MRIVFAKSGQEKLCISRALQNLGAWAIEEKEEVEKIEQKILQAIQQVVGTRVLVKIPELDAELLWKREVGGFVLMYDKAGPARTFEAKKTSKLFPGTYPLFSKEEKKALAKLAEVTRRFLGGYLGFEVVKTIPVELVLDEAKRNAAKVMLFRHGDGHEAIVSKKAILVLNGRRSYDKIFEKVAQSDAALKEIISEHFAHIKELFFLADDEGEAQEIVEAMAKAAGYGNPLPRIFQGSRGTTKITAVAEGAAVNVTVYWKRERGGKIALCVRALSYGTGAADSYVDVKTDKGKVELKVLRKDELVKRYLRRWIDVAEGNILDFTRRSALVEKDGVKILATRVAKVELPEEYQTYAAIDLLMSEAFNKKHYTEEDVEEAALTIIAHVLAGVPLT